MGELLQADLVLARSKQRENREVRTELDGKSVGEVEFAVEVEASVRRATQD